MKHLALSFLFLSTVTLAKTPNAPLHPEIAEALTKQVNSELAAAYTYLAMSSHFRTNNLDGFAHWFETHFYEELNHARKILHFLNDKGVNAAMPAIGEVKLKIERPLDAFAAALHHEEEQTAKIHAIFDKAKTLKSHDAEVLLHYFVDEQVEEEALFEKYKTHLELLGDKSPEGLLALDRELGARPAAKIE